MSRLSEGEPLTRQDLLNELAAEAIESYGPATSIDVTTSGPVTMPEHGIRMPAAVLYEARHELHPRY